MSHSRIVARLGTVALLVASSTLMLAAPPASATVQCSYDSNTRTATMTPSAADGSMTIYADTGNLAVNSSPCVALNQVNSVTINASARPDIAVAFSLDGGPLGPGYLDEGNGSSEIEFSVTGMGPSAALVVIGSTGNDGVSFGQYTNKATGVTTGQVNLNALADGATPDVDVSFTSFPGLIQVSAQGGDDTLTGAGTGVAFTGPIWTPLELNGAAGANTVTGGAGPDTLVFREETVGEGSDTLSGGGGTDTAQASTAGPAAVATITLDGVANDGSNCPGADCNGDNVGLDIEGVVGSFSSETIVGNSGPQYLAGGSDGNDALFGASGADELHATSGSAQGGAGNDLLVPESANCVLRGAKGRDTASFAAVNKSVVVTLDNVANDGPGGSTINVHSDIENITGTALSDTLIGNGAANTFNAGAGNDSLYGQGGKDTFLPGPGDDSASGGAGVDRLSFAASATPIVLDAVAKAVTGEGTDSFSSIESYVGSGLSDTMDGSGSAERFTGGAGDDDIFGAGGNARLLGGAGDDSLDGGDGIDTCTQGAGAGSIANCEG